MSNTDSFIDEVSEEVRRDRLFKVYKKYGWILVVLVVAIVGGAAWNEYSKANRIAQSEAAGRALQAANEAGDAALLNDLANSNSDTAVIAQLQQAAILAGADDAEGAKAITTLAEIVNAADASDALRQRAQELTIALGGSLDAANNG